ncbi:MAG: electron transfer flavoprotein subunit alpha/FixB family protein [Cyanobacteria bacterium HKST-UBA03]|nr:electron transfer flavoprotein subunit alpha/FixB family protein [Cyanobacteria bacterium HKST-UBA03]
MVTPPTPKDQFSGIWVVAERTQTGTLAEATFEALTAARQLAAEQGNTPITAVLLLGDGDTPDPYQADLAAHGATAVLALTSANLATYSGQGYTQALTQAIAAKKPALILAGATSTSKDYAPRLALAAPLALMPDATQLTMGSSGQVEVTRPVYAENMLTTVTAPDVRPQMVTLRAKAFRKGEAPAAGASVTTETMAVDVAAPTLQLVGISASEAASSGKSLADAEIVVAGGRGVKGPENFPLVEALAQSLGAAVGASRAVVDAGWRPHSEQVGQTGKTVSPNLYIALGIHGAIQHQVGMTSSRHIVAVNTNPDAPIFEIADFGIVGDLFEIAPLLTKTIKDKNLTPA